jgi:hypothetical protein
MFVCCCPCRLLQQALALVADVHNTLGHERPNRAAAGSSSSSGSAAWLAGADADHPTRAGLRIGKPHPEGMLSRQLHASCPWLLWLQVTR